jgi:predicted metalloendopeptidase
MIDNGGMRESLRAYRNQLSPNGEASLPGLSKYTNEQLFFMSYARVWCETKTVGALIHQLMGDPHPPAQVRIRKTF